MRRSWLIGASTLLAAYAAARCPPIQNAKSILTPGARIILGEIHGNAETPRFARSLACHAARRGAVRVGLEIPTDEQDRIDNYIVSGNRAALLKGGFWTNPHQDGRPSQEMVSLLDGLRELRGEGVDLQVIAFDGPGADRDLAMAEHLAAAFAAEPKATFVVLVGNLHARKNSGVFKKTFMAARLVEKFANVISLKAHYGEGASWFCDGEEAESCLPAKIGQGTVGAPTVTIHKSDDGAYDGQFEVASPTFSPPAGVSLTERQKAAAELVRFLTTAREDYAAKRYAKCADGYGYLAKRYANEGNEAARSAAYATASCYALAGDRDRAFSALSFAIVNGFSDTNATLRDSDLVSLREDTRWTPLVKRMRSVAIQINPALRMTLVKMGEDDQEDLKLGRQGRRGVGVDKDKKRIQLLKQIIAEYGWPGISVVGLDGTNGAWLVAQHADPDLAFQKECLSLVERSWAVGEVTGLQLAYLADRVFAAEGKQQLYGTQGSPRYSEEAKAEVEVRRRNLGLPTMAEMARLKAELYEQDVSPATAHQR